MLCACRAAAAHHEPPGPAAHRACATEIASSRSIWRSNASAFREPPVGFDRCRSAALDAQVPSLILQPLVGKRHPPWGRAAGARVCCRGRPPGNPGSSSCACAQRAGDDPGFTRTRRSWHTAPAPAARPHGGWRFSTNGWRSGWAPGHRGRGIDIGSKPTGGRESGCVSISRYFSMKADFVAQAGERWPGWLMVSRSSSARRTSMARSRRGRRCA